MSQLKACEYNRILVFREDIDAVSGFLQLRLSPHFLHDDRLDRDAMTRSIIEPYFVPENTPLHTQLVNFQKNKKRIGLAVDEYGSVMGLVTLEDILEEIVGEFTSDLADEADEIVAAGDGSFLIEGAASIREINRSLGWDLPVDGPKTLNGLLLEHLEAIPVSSVSLRIGSYGFEILSLKGNAIEQASAKVL